MTKAHDRLFAELGVMVERVRPHLKPVTTADIRARLQGFRERLDRLARASDPPPPPLLTSPRGLPRPLNPFYFARRRRQP